MCDKKRFIKTTAEEVGEEPDEYIKTEWWLDTHRPIKEKPSFIAVQTEEGKDPNDFVKHDRLNILYTDAAEWYYVCNSCYSIHSRDQWSGSTRGWDGWRERSRNGLKKHEETKGWCQFCDPIFGNGGWSVDL